MKTIGHSFARFGVTMLGIQVACGLRSAHRLLPSLFLLLFIHTHHGYAGCDGLGGSGDCSGGNGIYYETNNGFATVTGIVGLQGQNVPIPATLGGLPVVAIAPNAFGGRGITGVSIPDSVTTIGSNAFYYCTGLTNVTFGNGLVSIGREAFVYCPNLTNIMFPTNLASIGDQAFASCYSLSNINVPNAVTNIGELAFVYCNFATVTIGSGVSRIGVGAFEVSGLSVITVDASNLFYSSVQGVLFNKDQTTLVRFPSGKSQSYIIPNSVTNIGDAAFRRCLTNVTIPNSVIRIGANAFESSGLTQVSIGNGVTSIGTNAFYACTYLASVTFGTNVIDIEQGAFWNSRLTSLVLPESVKNIGVGAFSSSLYLTNLVLHNGVTNIGASAFNNCSGLTNLMLPASLTTIGLGAFRCPNLSSINVDPLNAAYASVEGVLFDKNLTTLIQCPGGKTGDCAIPAGVALIGLSAFAGCIDLTNITIPPSVTVIDDYAFTGCGRLTSLIIPDSVNRIGEAVFANCSALTNVVIGRKVATMGDRAFQSCSSLTSITIPDSVNRIGDYGFQSCSALTNILIGRGVVSIGKGAFSLCSGLVSIVIPSSVTQFGDEPFTYCSALSAVYFEGDAPILVWPLSLFLASHPTVYYLPGTAGWGATLDGRPTAPWMLPKPVILTLPPYFGVAGNMFGFRVSWATNVPVVVEACTNLATPDWTPVKTNALANGWTYFSDPEWTNYPSRMYRVRAQ